VKLSGSTYHADQAGRVSVASFFAALAALAFAKLATSFDLASADNFRFGAAFFAASDACASFAARNAAQRFFCAATMRWRLRSSSIGLGLAVAARVIARFPHLGIRLDLGNF
jgi:hypothetical protein